MTNQEKYLHEWNNEKKVGFETTVNDFIIKYKVMHAMRSTYLQACQYERTKDQKRRANGYEFEIIQTRMGEIIFAMINGPTRPYLFKEN